MPESAGVATVIPVSEEGATGRVAEIFAEIKETKGISFVPRIWQVLATNPTQLEVVWSSLKRLMHPESLGLESKLDPVVREMIAVAVSATNGCSYCVNSHTAILKKLGTDDETLGEVLALADGYQVESDVFPRLKEEPQS